MENRFEICCHDSLLIGTRSECDRLICAKGKHAPVFNLYYHKVNNEYFYCVNREQLGQYWHCVIEDRDTFCPDRCDKCKMCKEMSMFLLNCQIVIFYPRTDPANSQEEISYQPILWRIFTSVIDKNKRFWMEIGKSIPNRGLVLNYGKTC